MIEVSEVMCKDKKITFTVKKEFLEICENPEKFTPYELMTQYKIHLYLHNDNGPATVVHKSGHKEFWIDGQKIMGEAEAALLHNYEFAKKLENEMVSE